MLVSCGKPADNPAGPPPATGITQDFTKTEQNSPFCYVDRVGNVENPFSKGSVDISSSDQVTVVGWGVDWENKSPAATVEIAIDGIPYPARYGGDRLDVADHYKVPAYRNSGVEFSFPASLLSKGTHKLTMRVVPTGKRLYYEGPVLLIRIK